MSLSVLTEGQAECPAHGPCITYGTEFAASGLHSGGEYIHSSKYISLHLAHLFLIRYILSKSKNSSIGQKSSRSEAGMATVHEKVAFVYSEPFLTVGLTWASPTLVGFP